MQTDRTRRLAALALGTTAIFDVTGAVIYRVVRASLPTPPAPPAAANPFRQATQDLLDARREAIMQAGAKEDVDPPA